MANLDEYFAIQTFTIWVNNESMHYAICGANVIDMEKLITKAHKLFDTQKMSCSQTPCSQSCDHIRVEHSHCG